MGEREWIPDSPTEKKKNKSREVEPYDPNHYHFTKLSACYSQFNFYPRAEYAYRFIPPLYSLYLYHKCVCIKISAVRMSPYLQQYACKVLHFPCRLFPIVRQFSAPYALQTFSPILHKILESPMELNMSVRLIIRWRKD